MRPEERREFGRYLREQARERDAGFVDLDGDGVDDRIADDPGVLAEATARLRERQPDLLGQILGGGSGGQGVLANPLAKAALAGIAAMAAKRYLR
jgi:nicotinamide riboside kinase